jgi:hypothetical protein
MFKVWRLRHERDKSYEKYERKIEALRKQKVSSSDIASVSFEQWVDGKFYDNQIFFLLSRRLLDQADRYDIAIPDGDGIWERDSDSNDPNGPAWLSSKARAQVRNLISEEKKRRFNEKTQWVIKVILPLVVALAGLVGAATGFVLALKK